MIVNFLSGSKVYIVEPLTVLRNTNMDLNFTFTVGWSSGQFSGGAAASYLVGGWLDYSILMLISAKLS